VTFQEEVKAIIDEAVAKIMALVTDQMVIMAVPPDKTSGEPKPE
jgi:hypothetical protein